MRDPRRKSKKKSSPTKSTKDTMRRFIKNHGLQVLAATALIAGTAAAVKVTHDRHKTYQYAEDSYSAPTTKDTNPWTIPEQVSDELHPVISEATIAGLREEYKIVVVDWVYEKDREDDKYYESGKQSRLTVDTSKFLQEAWSDPESRLVTFVRHPFSCAN